MKLTIIIPSYNEAKTLPQVIKKVLAVKIPHQKEIIVVDDGSTDDTQAVIEKILKRPTGSPIKFLVNRRNLGKGAAIVRALAGTSGDLVLIQDADLEYDPRDIPKLLVPFKDTQVQAVYGSRVLKNNPISHWTFNLGGRLITAVTNLLYGTNITDEPTGYKLLRSNFIKGIKLKSRGFEFCPEITAKIAKAGVKITEVPVSYHPRPISQKKIKWQDGLAALYFLLKYRFFD